MTRDEVARHVAELLGLPARWASAHRSISSYDGCERTLEVFDADAGEQLPLLRRLCSERAALEHAAGGPLVIVFHTRAETSRLYPDVVAEPYAQRNRSGELADAPRQWIASDHEGQPAVDPSDIERFSFDGDEAA